MRTVADNLREMADEINVSLTSLLKTHSKIKFWNYQTSGLAVITATPYEWLPLEEEGHRLQSRILENYRRFAATVQTLLREQPTSRLEVLKESERTISHIIEQHGHTAIENIEEAVTDAVEAVDRMVALLDNLPSAAGTEAIFVPDTNALLFNPQLENWRFPAASRFIIVLTTTVVSELDKLKVTHRLQSLRKKAESIVTRIKGYRSRGQLTAGVPLYTGISSLVALAVEPDFANTLPWLDENNNDDRIIASVLEIMRRYIRSPVSLVTRDVNLQNKAEFARLPFSEPPTPLIGKTRGSI